MLAQSTCEALCTPVGVLPSCTPHSLLPARSALPWGTGEQQGQGQTCTTHRTTRAVGNHHQDQSRESYPSRAPWTSLATDTSVQRHALDGLASAPLQLLLWSQSFRTPHTPSSHRCRRGTCLGQTHVRTQPGGTSPWSLPHHGQAVGSTSAPSISPQHRWAQLQVSTAQERGRAQGQVNPSIRAAHLQPSPQQAPLCAQWAAGTDPQQHLRARAMPQPRLAACSAAGLHRPHSALPCSCCSPHHASAPQLQLQGSTTLQGARNLRTPRNYTIHEATRTALLLPGPTSPSSSPLVRVHRHPLTQPQP